MEVENMRVRKRLAGAEIAGAAKRTRIETSSEEDYTPETTSISPQSAHSPSVADTAATSRCSSRRPKKYMCTYSECYKAFDRPVRLQAHIRTHTDDRPFECLEAGCTKRFFKVEHLKAHAQNKHSNDASHVCTYVTSTNAEGEEFECGKAFTTSTRLRRHVAAHEDKEELKCQEVGCGMLFRKMETLQRHVKKDHLEEKAFRCAKLVRDDDETAKEECGQVFASVGQLKAHDSREHVSNKYTCSICHSDADSVAFPTYTALQSHLKAVHPPTCSTCTRSFPSNRALTAHMDIEHSSLSSRQKYPCPFTNCERAFTRNGNLSVHVQNVHVKEKKFVCGEFDLRESEKVSGWGGAGCGMRFGTKATLEEHVRTQHLDLPSSVKRKPRLDKKVRIKTEDPTDAPSSSDFALMHIDDVAPASHPVHAKSSNDNALSLLTGHGYASTRMLSCWTKSCPHRFSREYDLAVHMELAHEWNVDDINERLAEEEALQGGKFWVGGLDEEFDNYGVGEEAYGMDDEFDLVRYEDDMDEEMECVDPLLMRMA